MNIYNLKGHDFKVKKKDAWDETGMKYRTYQTNDRRM